VKSQPTEEDAGGTEAAAIAEAGGRWRSMKREVHTRHLGAAREMSFRGGRAGGARTELRTRSRRRGCFGD
jgi:hypothetical protein